MAAEVTAGRRTNGRTRVGAPGVIRLAPPGGVHPLFRAQPSAATVREWQRIAGGFAALAGRSVALAPLVPDTEPPVLVLAEVPRPGASLLKLPLVASLYVAAAEGRLDLGEPVAVDELRPSRWSSVSDALSRDMVLPLHALCSLAIAVSDNPSADFLYRRFGPEPANAWLCAIGCSPATALRTGFSDSEIEQRGRDNTIAARDCVMMLRAIFADDSCARLRLAMYNNIRNQRIPRLFDETVLVAHKTGSLTGVVNDVGVIDTRSGSFIVAFLCEAEADPLSTEAEVGRAALACVEAFEDAFEPQ